MFWNRNNGETIILEVEGMRCTQCEATIKIALHHIPGVQQVTIRQKRRVQVELAPQKHISRADLVTAIEQSGYKVATSTINQP
jgi:cation transport ATPase